MPPAPAFPRLTYLMVNQEISQLFEAIADALEFRGENRFRVNAYRRGAQEIADLAEDVTVLLAEKRLTEVPGIGKGLAADIEEYLASNRMTSYLEAMEGIPPALMELKVARSRRVVPGHEMLFVEWLLLQNPRATFSADHPRLPGQDHPGLGMLREVYGWLIVLCEALHLDGIAFVPSHYYMAALGRRLLRFLDPAAQARFEAMHDVLDRLTLAEASHALEAGQIRDAKTGTPAEWQPSVMVVPVSRRLRGLLEAPEYAERRVAERGTIEFRLGAEDASITLE